MKQLPSAEKRLRQETPKRAESEPEDELERCEEPPESIEKEREAAVISQMSFQNEGHISREANDSSNRSVQPGFVSFSFRLDSSPINFSRSRGRESDEMQSMELPLNLTPSNLPSNGVSFAIEEEAEEQSVAKRTPRLLEDSAQKPAAEPRELSPEEGLDSAILGDKVEGRRRGRNERQSSRDFSNEQKTSAKYSPVPKEKGGMTKEAFHQLKVVKEEASLEERLPTPREAHTIVPYSLENKEEKKDVTGRSLERSAESLSGFVCFELLDGDVLDLIGEFLGGGQVPQFAMTCRTLYRGLLEYKIENYALQEEMLKEQVEELHEEGAYNRVHLARGLLSLGGGG